MPDIDLEIGYIIDTYNIKMINISGCIVLKERLLKFVSHISTYFRWAIVTLILLILMLGIIGFVMRWYILVVNPKIVFTDFYSFVDDLFALILVYEFLDLLRTLAPTRLLDLLLTVMGRKMLLAHNNQTLMFETGVFAVLLLLRLFWNRFSREKEQ